MKISSILVAPLLETSSATPTPIEAVRNLHQVAVIIGNGQPLPPTLRSWLTLAIRRRLADQGSSLDSLLGLKSRHAGRLHAFSSHPQRDAALRRLAGSQGTQTERVQALRARILAHHETPDDDLAAIESKYGQIPTSTAQLHRIVAGKTVAARYIA